MPEWLFTEAIEKISRRIDNRKPIKQPARDNIKLQEK